VPFATLARSADPALRPRTTQPFSLLGVTWTNPAASPTGTVQVRTRSRATGHWSTWRTLESDGSQPGDARGSTDPLWVGDSNGVQARITGGHTTPAGLRVDLINPHADPAPTHSPSTNTTASAPGASGTPTAATSPAPSLGGTAS